MRNVLIAIVAVALTGSLASRAEAQSAQDRNDTRCLMVLQIISQDPKQREAASKGLFFYLGRLTSRGPVGRLPAIIASEAKAVSNQQQAQAELTRCGAELNVATGQFQAILKAFAEAARQPKLPSTKAQ